MFKTLMTKAGRSYRAAMTRYALDCLSDDTLRDIGIRRRDIGAVSRGKL